LFEANDTICLRKLIFESSDDDSEDLVIQQQKSIQQAAERRKRAQQDDEEFVRQLLSQESNQSQRPQASNTGSSYSKGQSSLPNSGPNAFQRMSGVRPSQPHSNVHLMSSTPPAASFSRTLPSTFNSKPLPSNNTIKAEANPHTGFRPNTAVSSSDKARSEVSLLDDSDSDVEIIAPNAFRSNGRHQPTSRARNLAHQPAGLGPPQKLKSEASALSHALWSGQSEQHPWMDYDRSSMDSSQGPNSAGQYVYPRPYSEQIPDLFGAYVPDQIPDLFGAYVPDPTLMFQSPRGNEVAHTGLQNENTRPGLNSFFSSTANPFDHSLNRPYSEFDDLSTGPTGNSPFTDINRMANFPGHGGLGDPSAYTGYMAEQYDYIMNDPRKTNDEIKSLLENIQSDVDLAKENREGTPDGLKYPLVSLQIHHPLSFWVANRATVRASKSCAYLAQANGGWNQ
jgi:hypothetical protein